VLGRAATRSNVLVPKPLCVGAVRFAADYDWNQGVPGSRMRNPAPDQYDDVYPGQGKGWWALIGLATTTWFWGNYYDLARPVNIAIGLFGPNMPI